jgi:hypothetical protein
MISPATLDSALQAEPPVGVLVGFEKTGEELFSDYARRRGFELQQPWADERSLWVDRRR